MAHLGGHERAKYTTGTQLRTSDGRGWTRLRAERWTHSEGDLGEVEVRDTEVIVMLRGQLPIRRRGDGREQRCDAVPGTIWLCPAGVQEDMIHLYGEVRERLHLFLPASPLSETALREMDVDADRVNLRYDGGIRDPLIEQIARNIRAELLDPAPAGKILVKTSRWRLAFKSSDIIPTWSRHRFRCRPAVAPLIPSAFGALQNSSTQISATN